MAEDDTVSDDIAPSPAPGWYPDPDDASKQRYWDGQAWSMHRRSTFVGNAAQPPPAPSVQAGSSYAVAASVKPGMAHSAILLVASFLLAGVTFGVSLVAAIFAALASWSSYQSGQAVNRGDIITATRKSKDAKLWRRITYIFLIIIGGLAVVAFFLFLVFAVMLELTYAY